MRIALFADIHEDIVALKEALLKIEKSGYDVLVCLGDICGFSIPFYHYHKTRDAHGCLNLIREKCDIIIPGNHDMFAARVIPEHSDIFSFPPNWYDLDFKEKKKIAEEHLWLNERDELNPLLTEEDLRFVKSLPEYEVREWENKKILFSHYIYPNLSGFARGFYSIGPEFSDHLKWMTEQGADYSFTAHAHPRGIYYASKKGFKHPRRKIINIPDKPVIFGIPPVTRNNRKSGFAIVDFEKNEIKAYRVKNLGNN